ncbi:MAG TPA: FMN-binding protein [Candidatus Paceibacterota bacterium]
MKKYLIGLVTIAVIGGFYVLYKNQHAVSAPQTQSVSKSPSVVYKDGTYTGSVANAFYGNVQVQTTIQGGSITNVAFLQYPDTHSTSVQINDQAMQYLQREAIQAQSASVNIVSGATDTSEAFQQSLASALTQAQS